MMQFHVCLIQPEGYVHSGAFYELAELIALGLRDLGYPCAVELNGIDPDARNILIGCHLLDPAQQQQLRPDTIILNTEQLPRNDSPIVPLILNWARRFEVWDYSAVNRDWLKENGAPRVHLLGIGFHPGLLRIAKDEEDIDVLFYGSLNDRRIAVLQGLQQAGLVVKHLFGVYGQERDGWISRAKVVLNMHYHDAKIFEIVRVHYLMNNAKAVVCEVGPDTLVDPQFLGGFHAASYERLVSACLLMCADTAQRSALERQAIETISRIPQRTIMSALVASIGT